MPATVVKMTIKSSIPDFPPVVERPMDTTKTWAEELLRMYNIVLPDNHCFKHASATAPFFPYEKIQIYISSFHKKKLDGVYLTRLVRMSKADKEEEQRKLKKETTHKGGKIARSPVAKIRRTNAGPVAGTSRTRNIFEEDGYPNDQAHDYRADIGDLDDDDTISMCSQDSQDSQGNNLEDIKHLVLDNFMKKVSNATLHVVRNEMNALRKQRKMLKCARYIPLTMNFLTEILDVPENSP